MRKTAFAFALGLALTLPAGAGQSQPMKAGKMGQEGKGSVNRTESQAARRAQGTARRATGSASGSRGSMSTGSSKAFGSANRMVTGTGSSESRNMSNHGAASNMNRGKIHKVPR